MAIKIVEVKLDKQNSIVGQNVFIEVEIIESNWENVSKSFLNWQDIKTKFASWLSLKNH